MNAVNPVNKPAARTKKILFVCVGNTCRSQIAEALARHLAADVLEPYSAGISPYGRIIDPTRKILLERGVGIGEQFSKGLPEAPADTADLVVNMTGIPGKSLFPNRPVVDWEIDDPYGESPEVYRRIREEIEERVVALAAELRGSASAAPQTQDKDSERR